MTDELIQVKTTLVQIINDFEKASQTYKEQTQALYSTIRHQIKIRALTAQECNCFGCRSGKQRCGYTISFVATYKGNKLPRSVQSTTQGIHFDWIPEEDWFYPLGYGATKWEALKNLLDNLMVAQTEYVNTDTEHWDKLNTKYRSSKY